MEELKQILEFQIEATKFKQLTRHCYTKENKFETVPEHTWQLSMFILTLEKYFEKDINITKLLKLSIVHDLPEIYAGDIHAFAKDKTGKEKKEKESIEKLYSLLPQEINNDLYELYLEYESLETRESKIIKALDKLMPLIQNISTTKHNSSYRDAKVNYKKTIEYIDQFFKETPDFINKLYKELLKQCEEKKVFYEK